MAVFSSFSLQYADAACIAQDLIKHLPADLPGSPVGLLATLPDVPKEELIALLCSKLPFPVVGGTTLEQPFEPRGSDVSARLVVYSKEDVSVSVALSEELGPFESIRMMEDVYTRSVHGLNGATPKLFFVILPLLPNLASDAYLPHFFACAGKVPVFGGMVSDELPGSRFAVYGEGGAHANRMAVVAFGGDIEPFFQVGCRHTTISEYSPTVTQAHGDTVMRVDNITFVEYLEYLGVTPDITESGIEFPLTMLVRSAGEEQDDIENAQVLISYDPVSGSGVFSGTIPVGARITASMLSKDDIMSSAEDCLQPLSGVIPQDADSALVLCVSCVGRYFVLVGRENTEGELIRKLLPENAGIFGYYGFSEICPSRNKQSGQLINRTYCDSIVICVL